MADPHDIRSLFLVLTAGCNLSCAYCYQTEKQKRRMTPEILHKSLDWALASRRDDVEVVFFGGEPLMEFELIRDAVEYVQARGKKGSHIRYGMITNGTLLRGERLAFVARHRFDTQLSFDGVAAAQNMRGPGTFPVLDAMLDTLREGYRDFFTNNLKVSLTYVPSTIRHLADSVEYFLGKGLQRFSLSPVFTATDGWPLDQIDELEGQFERIFDMLLAHFHETGTVPFIGFQNDDQSSPHLPQQQSMCGVMRGEIPTVDVDGEVHGCATFTESFQGFSNAFLRERIESMRLGPLDGPDFNRRYQKFDGATENTEIFHNKQDKYSEYGQCGECEFLDSCAICPMSIGHIPGNRDPRRVPDFPCASNLIALKYRKRFLEETSPWWLLFGERSKPAAILELERAAYQFRD